MLNQIAPPNNAEQVELFRPSQWLCFDEIWFGPSRDIGFFGSRRLGKTQMSIDIWMQLVMYKEGDLPATYRDYLDSEKMDNLIKGSESLDRLFKGALVLPEADQAEIVAKPLFYGLISRYAKLGWSDRFRVSGTTLNYHTGVFKGKSEILWQLTTHGLKNADSKRGIGGDIIFLDEYQDMNEEDLGSVIRPIRNDNPYSVIVATATTKPIATVKEKMRLYKENKHKQGVFITLDDRIDLGEVTEEHKQLIIDLDYDGNDQDPQYLAEYQLRTDLPVQHAVLEYWNRKVMPKSKKPATKVLAMDLGFKAAYSLVEADLWEVSKEGKQRLQLTDAYEFHNKTNMQIIEAVRDRHNHKHGDPPVFDFIIVPHDAYSKGLDTGYSTEYWWRNSGLAKKVILAKQFRKAGEERVRSGLLENIQKVYLAKDFPKDIMDHYNNVRFKLDPDGLPTDKLHDSEGAIHATDALIYLVGTAFANHKLWKYHTVRIKEEKDELQMLLDRFNPELATPQFEEIPGLWQEEFS